MNFKDKTPWNYRIVTSQQHWLQVLSNFCKAAAPPGDEVLQGLATETGKSELNSQFTFKARQWNSYETKFRFEKGSKSTISMG